MYFFWRQNKFRKLTEKIIIFAIIKQSAMSEEEKKQIQMDMSIEKAVELVTEAAKEV